MGKATIPFLLALGLVQSGCGVGWSSPAPHVPEDVVRIIRAVDARDHGQLKVLLEGGAVPTPTGSPLSPLHAAIMQFAGVKADCDATSLKLLLDHGADPNFVDDWSGFAPLEEALSVGDIECAQLLKAAGADVSRHGKSGQSMLQFAVKGALLKGDTDAVKLVLSWGVDTNVRGKGIIASTALHEAIGANWGAVDEGPLVAELLRGGANPCVVDDAGRTPLDEAVARDRPAIQAVLTAAMHECPPAQRTRSSKRLTLLDRLVGR